MRDAARALRESVVRGLGLRADNIHEGVLLRGAAALGSTGTESGMAEIARRLADLHPDDPDWHDVASHFLVSESWFMRNRPTIEAVLDMTFKRWRSRSLLSRRGPVIWSLGCARGEEPCTVALLADLRAETPEIIGIDLSREALSSARRGVYRARDLRELTGPEIATWFRPDGAGGYALDPRILASVRYRSVNLAGSLAGLRALPEPDLVLCRNVLMYLEDTVRKRLIETLASLMPIGSFLVVGSAEGLIMDRTSFVRETKADRTGIYRRAQTNTGVTNTGVTNTGVTNTGVTNTGVNLERKHASAPPAMPRAPNGALVSPTAREPTEAGSGPARESLSARARESPSARHETLPRIAADAWRKAAAEADERGDLDSAEASVRKAIYLDPASAADRYLLGCLLFRRGRFDPARRCFEAALDLFDANGPRADPTGTDGAHPARLATAARLRLAEIGRQT